MRTKPVQCGFRSALAAASLLMATSPVWATEAGFRQFDASAQGRIQEAIHVALFYPTQDSARAIAMGPFTPTVAINGKPDASVKGLLLLTHGTGGTELGHHSLAQALARNGYLVAAMRHPGDNWQDQSLLGVPGGYYFSERPRQASRVIDAILLDPEWTARIKVDAHGPRVGAVGHSAGGYTVLALAGGVPDLARIASHCKTDSNDPIFCSMGRRGTNAATAKISFEGLQDARVRAVAALAPASVMFSAQSLATIGIPATVYAGDKDTFLVPRYHAEWVRQNVAKVAYHAVPNAGHYAFMDTPSMPIPSPDGDLRANPEGLDRSAFQKQLATELNRFFDSALQ
ncbi:dienelactone hydrolase [Noviherbaspirillum sp. L7-7A]|uniref:alpha/beta hydrolase family protein n=1 Tax=Noviherbaspirillum sp. L7-7A TaxID=2850560 RepID=UPI001C2C247A|nr:alpha/beta fold hydrolase [Noviherbaspirillum sp. L7-7A]MBV0882078.1 dienelactone hydrolase [Noviherbaspirillum sp. L7-7A]